MRFTGIKELKQKTMSVIEACKMEDVIITAYGKPTAILHHIADCGMGYTPCSEDQK
jgi:antitoxin (DNA-binding transcriptional repressor) of toxin-antitoxin stability system